MRPVRCTVVFICQRATFQRLTPRGSGRSSRRLLLGRRSRSQSSAFSAAAGPGPHHHGQSGLLHLMPGPAQSCFDDAPSFR
jgi:hypothetical protein